MGTRNLTMVYVDGAYKIAQYGQWDGYPQGQGLTALSFLRDKMSRDMFLKKVRAVQEISKEEHKALWVGCGADPNDKNGFVSLDIAAKFKNKYSQLDRDAGAGILHLVQDAPAGIKLKKEIEFAADSLSCEWAYVLDFDKDTFEVYQGFNVEPLKPKDRFYFLEEKARKSGKDAEYYPVRLLKSWNLKKLPTEDSFIKICDEEEKAHDIIDTIIKSKVMPIPSTEAGSYSRVLQGVLRDTKSLPLLIGLDEGLDKMLDRRMRKARVPLPQ